MVSADLLRTFGYFATAMVAIILWYYFKFMLPYSKFPSFRLDIWLIYSVLTGKPLKQYVLQKIIEVCKRFQKEGICVLWCGAPIVFVYDPEIIKSLIDDSSAVEKPKLYSVFKSALGDTIFTSNGEQLKKHRRIINPVFQVVSLKHKVPIINMYAARLVQKLDELNNMPTDETRHLLKECFLRISFKSLVGVDEESNPAHFVKVNRMIEIIGKLRNFVSERTYTPWLKLDTFCRIIPSARRNLNLLEEGCNISMELLNNVKDSIVLSKSTAEQNDPGNNQRTPMTMSELLLEEHLRDPSFTLKNVMGTTHLFLLAENSTSDTLLWCLFLLGHNLDVQEQVYQEVKDVVTDEDMSYEDLKNLEYLECVIMETMRVYPIVPLFARSLGKDTQFGKYTVLKGSTVVLFPCLLHKNPDIYPDPEKFDPERFRAKNLKIRPWNFIPFAEGARVCPGKLSALMEIKMILAHILRNFKVISLDRPEDIEVTWEITLVPVNPVNLKFISRQTHHPD